MGDEEHRHVPLTLPATPDFTPMPRWDDLGTWPAYARVRAHGSWKLSALRLLPPQAPPPGGIRVTRWHPDHEMAHLTLALGRRRGLQPNELHVRLTELRALGYRGVVTAALAVADQSVFLDTGFRVVERLHLLRHRLEPEVSRSSIPTRRARRRDRPGVLAVDRASFAPFWQLNETTLADALAATRMTRWRVVTGPEDQIIGYAICGRSGPRGYFQRLAVHPDHQGQGIGAALVADGLAWLARRGAHDALVNTQVGNQRSLRLYRRSGFVLQPEELAVLRLDFTSPPVGEGPHGPAAPGIARHP